MAGSGGPPEGASARSRFRRIKPVPYGVEMVQVNPRFRKNRLRTGAFRGFRLFTEFRQKMREGVQRGRQRLVEVPEASIRGPTRRMKVPASPGIFHGKGGVVGKGDQDRLVLFVELASLFIDGLQRPDAPAVRRDQGDAEDVPGDEAGPSIRFRIEPVVAVGVVEDQRAFVLKHPSRHAGIRGKPDLPFPRAGGGRRPQPVVPGIMEKHPAPLNVHHTVGLLPDHPEQSIGIHLRGDDLPHAKQPLITAELVPENLVRVPSADPSGLNKIPVQNRPSPAGSGRMRRQPLC